MVDIIEEIPCHIAARERLLDNALGAERFRKTSERLREGRFPAEQLAFSAVEGDRLVGTLRLWPILAGSQHPALLLGPLAVDSAWRRCKLGTRLMQHAICRARQLGHRAILLVGDAPYYCRFGFSPHLTRNLELPGPVDINRFLGLELVPGALSGACGLVSAADISGTQQEAPLAPYARQPARNGTRTMIPYDTRSQRC